MTTAMPLPPTIRAEVKLTTGSNVSVASRELEALAPVGRHDVGVVAALFWCDDHDIAGRWFIIDAALLPERSAETVSFTRSIFVSTAHAHRHLSELRRHVDENWPSFLCAFQDTAHEGHDVLVPALERAHADGKLREHFPADGVLDYEHRATVQRLIEHHGESNAGRILQDLLAYVIAMGGYGSVTNNPVGVPDFVVSGLDSDSRVAAQATPIMLTSDEIDRLVAHCRTAGDDELAHVVARQQRGETRKRR